MRARARACVLAQACACTSACVRKSVRAHVRAPVTALVCACALFTISFVDVKDEEMTKINEILYDSSTFVMFSANHS